VDEMNFDETIAFLERHIGKTVEVAIEIPEPSRDEPAHVAAFWGRLGGLTKSGPSGAAEVRCVWMRDLDETSPFMDEFHLHRGLFEDAEVHASVGEEDDERSNDGATWTLTINQRGVRTRVAFYL
jgi:hypothetical protein